MLLCCEVVAYDEEAIIDYLREVLEECIGLDVTGDPLLERLSLQHCSHINSPNITTPSMVDLALGLRINRFTVCGSNNNPSSNYNEFASQEIKKMNSTTCDSVGIHVNPFPQQQHVFSYGNKSYQSLVAPLYDPLFYSAVKNKLSKQLHG